MTEPAIASPWPPVAMLRCAEPLTKLLHARARACAPDSTSRGPEAVRLLFARVVEEWGRLDLLFNNADTNLTGSFLCAREAFRVMKAQKPRGGRIINSG